MVFDSLSVGYLSLIITKEKNVTKLVVIKATI